MKILSVSGLLENNSAAWRIKNIAQILSSYGHEIKLIQYGNKSSINFLKTKTVDLKPLSTSTVVARPLTYQIRNFIEVCRDHYDLVYGNTHAGTFISMFSRFKLIPLIFDFHGGLVEELLLNQGKVHWDSSLMWNKKYWLSKIIDTCDRHFSSKIICVSNRMIKYLNEIHSVPLSKMAYVTNGVDLDYFKSKDYYYTNIMKKNLGIDRKFIVGYIGASDKWQGLDNLIKVADLIKDPHIQFIFVGGDIDRKIDNKLFVSKKPICEVIDYYSICDILVLPRPLHPATEIAAPTKFAEYTSMGKPILITDVGDAADLVNKYKCGTVVRDNSPKQLFNGLLELKNTNSIELYNMGLNSRILAENEFDWKKVANNLELAIKNIINNA